MEIKILGFGFEPKELAPAIPAAEICPLLGGEEPFAWKDLKIACRELDFQVTNRGGQVLKEKWWGGVLMKIRDAHQYMVMTVEEGRTVLTAEQLDPNKRLVEVGFFLVHPQTGCGLLSYYYQAGSMRSLGQIVNRAYRNECRSRIKDIQEDPDLEPDERREEALKYRGSAFLNQIALNTSLPDLVRDLQRVQKVRIGVQSLGVVAPKFRPFEKIATSRSLAFNFDSEANVNDIAGYLENLHINDDEEITVNGTDKKGDRQTYRASANPFIFGRFDFDEMSAGMVLDLKDWQGSIRKSKMIEKLHQITTTAAIRAHLATPVEP